MIDKNQIKLEIKKKRIETTTLIKLEYVEIFFGYNGQFHITDTEIFYKDKKINKTDCKLHYAGKRVFVIVIPIKKIEKVAKKTNEKTISDRS